jgi:hypothetical protein
MRVETVGIEPTRRSPRGSASKSLQIGHFLCSVLGGVSVPRCAC